MLFVINEDPVSTKHISWFTKPHADSDGMFIQLFEVVESSYRHPQAPGHAIIKVVEMKFRDKASRLSDKAATWILLEASLKAIG